jgi:hypothetical protein
MWISQQQFDRHGVNDKSVQRRRPFTSYRIWSFRHWSVELDFRRDERGGIDGTGRGQVRRSETSASDLRSFRIGSRAFHELIESEGIPRVCGL